MKNEPVKNPKLKPKPVPGPKKPVPGPKRPRPTGLDKVGPFGPKGTPLTPQQIKDKQPGSNIGKRKPFPNKGTGKGKPVMPPR